MLGSVEFLRRPGAVIDFERDQVVFTKIYPETVIPLERSTSGGILCWGHDGGLVWQLGARRLGRPGARRNRAGDLGIGTSPRSLTTLGARLSVWGDRRRTGGQPSERHEAARPE